MIISRTPFRISLFGGGTDYPTWFREHGGAVLGNLLSTNNVAITLRRLPPFFEHRSRIVYSQVELVNAVSEIRHPAVRAVLSDQSITEGLEIHHDADLPARSGLGSSSSFTVWPSQRALCAREQDDRQTRSCLRSDQDRAGCAQGTGWLAGSNLGGLWRLQPLHDFFRDGTFAVFTHHPPSGAAPENSISSVQRVMLFLHRTVFRASPAISAQVEDQDKEHPRTVRTN